MSQQESQPYDRALKSLLGDETAEILPNLLPESELVGEENIEIDRTTLKADLVYNILYKGQPHILNMELQTDADSNMPRRILKYHVGLHDKHGAQKIVTGVIGARFPTLAELAKQRVTLIRSTEALDILAKQVVAAPDEATARWVLNTFAA